MAIYIKLAAGESSLHLASKSSKGPEVNVPGDGQFHLIPDELAQLSGVAKMLANHRLTMSTAADGSAPVTTVPAPSGGTASSVADTNVTGLIADLAAKVTAVATPNQLYGTNGSGNQVTGPWSGGADANTFVIRDNAGAITTATPTAVGHATTKSYVDALIAAGLSVVTYSGSLTTARPSGVAAVYWVGFPSTPTNALTQDIVETTTPLQQVMSVKDNGAVGDGTTDDTTAINAVVTAAVAAKLPVYFPAGNYKVSSVLNWKIPGLVVKTAGPYVTTITQATANTPIVQVAGGQQDIGGLKLAYASQRPSTETNSICITFGDDTVGSSFNSRFHDLICQQGAIGMAINPSIATVAGLFSCQFDNNRVLGYSIGAIQLIGGNNTGANCTGVVFNNTYTHNNFNGTDSTTSTSYPVLLRNWDEVVFNQLNIEHGANAVGDDLAIIGCGSVTINSLHYEERTLSGNGFALMYVSNSKLVVNGGTSRFSTFSGSAKNSLVRLYGTSKVTINGWTDSSNTVTTPARYVVDFGSATSSQAIVTSIDLAQFNATRFTGGDSTDTAVIGDLVSQASAASTISQRNAYGQLLAASFIPTATPVTTTGGSTTLLVTSGEMEIFTGTNTQTVVLPTNSVVAGHPLTIVNQSTGIVTVNASGGGILCKLEPKATLRVQATAATPTSAAQWAIIGGTAFAAGELDPNSLWRTAGYSEPFNRSPFMAALAQGSGTATFSFFTAPVANTITKLGVAVNDSSAQSGITLCRLGLYTVDASGNLTQVARTANNTTIGATASAVNSASLDATLVSSYTYIPGQRYAKAFLQVGTTPANISAIQVDTRITGLAPRLVGAVNGASDLVASYTAATIANWWNGPYVIGLP